jgi:hypothetical protein
MMFGFRVWILSCQKLSIVRTVEVNDVSFLQRTRRILHDQIFEVVILDTQNEMLVFLQRQCPEENIFSLSNECIELSKRMKKKSLLRECTNSSFALSSDAILIGIFFLFMTKSILFVFLNLNLYSCCVVWDVDWVVTIWLWTWWKLDRNLANKNFVSKIRKWKLIVFWTKTC